jgi:drug/metabolite transporter (DMT)-like permease
MNPASASVEPLPDPSRDNPYAASITQSAASITQPADDSIGGGGSLPYVWMLLGSVAFATMSALAHALGPYLDWRVTAIARTGLALIFTLILCWQSGVRLVIWRPATLWMRSIAGAGSLVLGFYALPKMPVGEMLALTHLFPLWVALFSWPVLGLKPTIGVWIAIVAGILGVWLIELPYMDLGDGAADQTSAHALLGRDRLAALAALAASFTSAVALLGLHRLKHIDPRAIVVHFSAVALIACVAFLFLGAGDGHALLPPLKFAPLAMLIGVGLTATAGQLFLTKAFTAGAPARVSVVGLSQVVFGMLFDLVIWQRSLSPLTALGMLFVLVPTGWVLWRSRARELTEVGDA